MKETVAVEKPKGPQPATVSKQSSNQETKKQRAVKIETAARPKQLSPAASPAQANRLTFGRGPGAATTTKKGQPAPRRTKTTASLPAKTQKAYKAETAIKKDKALDRINESGYEAAQSPIASSVAFDLQSKASKKDVNPYTR